MVLCFGDSITQGKPGVTYLRFLNRRKYKNCGLGGDTLLGMFARIHPYIDDSRYNNFIIEIGANDLLQPYLSSCSPGWNKVFKLSVRHGKIPCRSVEHFAESYQSLLSKLKGNNKSAIAVSIPCLGEDTGSELNMQVDRYNEVVSQLCREYNFAYIDFNAWQKRMIKENKANGEFFLSKDPFDTVADSIISTYLHMDGKLSKKRGLAVTVDGIHLNGAGARALAGMIGNLEVGGNEP